MKILVRITALILLLGMLSGCYAEKAVNRVFDHEVDTPETAPTLPTQLEMPQEQLQAALARLEYAAICAAIAADNQAKWLDSYYFRNIDTYIGDYDGDGMEELVYGPYALSFDAGTRGCAYYFSQSGYCMHTAKDGTLYLEQSMSGGYQHEQDGMLLDSGGESVWFEKWQNDMWKQAFSEERAWDKEVIVDEEGMFVSFGKTLSETHTAEIADTEVSLEEYEAHKKSLGLTEITTGPADFTQNRFDSVYSHHLLTQLDQYLSSYYNCRRITSDYDGDGYTETLFFVSRLGQPWLDRIDSGMYESSDGDRYYFQSGFDAEIPRTTVLVADLEGSELVVDALCTLQDLNIYEGMAIRRSAGFLWADEQPIYLPGGFAQADAGQLIQYAETFGYTNGILKAVDVTDFDGPEFLCLCQKDGVWHILIFVFENGDPRPVYNGDLSSSAVYLVEHEGKQCLLTYTQRVYTTMGGQTRTDYSYDLIRISIDGWSQSLDYHAVSYSDEDTDATAVSQFFEKLNVYLVKIIVLRDPYQLKGHMWPTAGDIDYGTAPQEPQQSTEEKPEGQEPVMGFVQINDPTSWLHLRVGPGTEYDRVLMDPNDPNSFVRQALGSPVTVLETIHTGDGENPTWVKIRITYAEQEIVGYSSKRYIRIPSEE